MNTQCALCDNFSTHVDEIVYVKCELADDACNQTHAWCKDCWMSELFDFCLVEKKKWRIHAQCVGNFMSTMIKRDCSA